jgi:MAF protein
MDETPFLILASNSPRRKSLLELTGWEFKVQPSQVDETLMKGEEPWDYVVRLAQNKAGKIAHLNGDSGIILAADTTVADQDAILGKPQDSKEAADMLRGLRGHAHQVYTGLAMCRSDSNNMVTDLCVTNVPMRNYTDDEVQKYVESGDPLDKAGAYAIQHPDFHPVDKLQGCYASVMGLPLCHLKRSLTRLGVSSKMDIAAKCQSALEYKCPIWQAVLNNEPLG